MLVYAAKPMSIRVRRERVGGLFSSPLNTRVIWMDVACMLGIKGWMRVPYYSKAEGDVYRQALISRRGFWLNHNKYIMNRRFIPLPVSIVRSMGSRYHERFKRDKGPNKAQTILNGWWN
jgi:hypothetical protein